MLRHLSILIILTLTLVIGVFVFQVVPKSVKGNRAVFKIGNQSEFKVDVADNPISRTRGLSGRESLKEDEGLLFVFDIPGIYGFWMKDMLFPIDIVWIAKGEVVGVADNLPPDDRDDRLVYYPPVAVDMALEINAGEAEKYMIRKGDKTQLKI